MTLMMLIMAAGLVVAVVRVFARPGSAAAAAALPPLRRWPVAVGCLLLQLYLMGGAGMQVPWRTGLIWGTHAALAAVAVANLRRPWMPVLLAGLLMNLAVMAANGGLMPVSPETLVRGGNGHVLERVPLGQPLPRSKDVILPPDETRLLLLSDVLVLPGLRGSFSPGDVVIAIGVFLVLQAAGGASRGLPWSHRQPVAASGG